LQEQPFDYLFSIANMKLLPRSVLSLPQGQRLTLVGTLHAGREIPGEGNGYGVPK